jgi:dephospho-CoA kinase
MIIGLTGTYCAGKNRVASLLEVRGLSVLDVDKLGYKALELEKEVIYAKFSTDLQKADSLNPDSWNPKGSLDRRLLGRIVFNNPEKLAVLEAIIHPVVDRLANEWIAAQKGHCVINAALLHRSNVFNRLDRLILVTAPFLIRFLRAKKRDKLPYKELIRRFNNQKDFNTQYLSVNAEIYRVGNSGFSGCRKLESQIDKIIKRIN